MLEATNAALGVAQRKVVAVSTKVEGKGNHTPGCGGFLRRQVILVVLIELPLFAAVRVTLVAGHEDAWRLSTDAWEFRMLLKVWSTSTTTASQSLLEFWPRQ
jgi:hypothetical protein